MKKPKFSISKHKDIGDKLFATREELTNLYVEIGNSYPNTSKAFRLVGKAQKAIDDLRGALESQMFKDHPTETGIPDSMNIYFPGARQRK